MVKIFSASRSKCSLLYCTKLSKISYRLIYSFFLFTVCCLLFLAGCSNRASTPSSTPSKSSSVASPSPTEIEVIPYDPEYNPDDIHPDPFYDQPTCLLVTQESDLAKIGALLYEQMHAPYLDGNVSAENRLISFEIVDADIRAVRLDAENNPFEWIVRILYDMQTALPYGQSIWKPSNGDIVNECNYQNCGTFLWVRKINHDTYQVMASGTGLTSFDMSL